MCINTNHSKAPSACGVRVRNNSEERNYHRGLMLIKQTVCEKQSSRDSCTITCFYRVFSSLFWRLKSFKVTFCACHGRCDVLVTDVVHLLKQTSQSLRCSDCTQRNISLALKTSSTIVCGLRTNIWQN
jgi:hypothetical protein